MTEKTVVEVPSDEPFLEGDVVMSRVEQAYEMKVSGASLSDIAIELGYPNAIAVGQDIAAELKKNIVEVTPEERQGLLSMELVRLDKLQKAVWKQAMYGDPKAIETVLKIMDQRAKRLQFEAVEASTGQATVLVISGHEADYVKKLKEIVNG